MSQALQYSEVLREFHANLSRGAVFRRDVALTGCYVPLYGRKRI